jgi:putative transposase
MPMKARASRLSDDTSGLAVVVDLYSRLVAGWGMSPPMTTDAADTALFGAIRRRGPEKKAIAPTDRGSRFSSDAWIRYCRAQGRRGQ